MKPSARMSVAVSAGSAVLSNDHYNLLTFIGASCNAGLSPMTMHVSMIPFTPEKGKDAVVAVTSYYNPPGKTPTQNDQFFIGVTWEGEKLIVNLDQNFVSPLGRLGSINDHGNIETLANGQRFISINLGYYSVEGPGLQKEKDRLIAKGYRLIDDPNLICKYLVGDVIAEDLELAATEDKRTETERKLDETEKLVIALRESARQAMGWVETFKNDNLELGQTIQGLKTEVLHLKASKNAIDCSHRAVLLKIYNLIGETGFGTRKKTNKTILEWITQHSATIGEVKS